MFVICSMNLLYFAEIILDKSRLRKGYAVRMLRETLAFARGLGLERVMLDCDADNTGALKTILKCGGVFEKDTLCEYRGKQIRNRHFWISLT
ncbi:Predicted acetyltransferase [Fusicatenibacter sp. 2789STDY5834925]|nr:Predicted acetyltransferase [Fusicatenibacter sp. 2789STDY5834925]